MVSGPQRVLLAALVAVALAVLVFWLAATSTRSEVSVVHRPTSALRPSPSPSSGPPEEVAPLVGEVDVAAADRFNQEVEHRLRGAAEHCPWGAVTAVCEGPLCVVYRPAQERWAASAWYVARPLAMAEESGVWFLGLDYGATPCGSHAGATG